MKTWVLFMITGRGINPEEISRQLKIKPDKIKQNSFTGEISWQIQSSLEGNQNLIEHLEEILKRIYPVRKIIQGYSKKYHTSFICNLNIEKSDSSIVIPSKYLSLIGYLGSNLEIYF